MTSRIIESEHDRQSFIRFLMGKRLPLTVNVEQGKHRTTRQNRLQRQWCNEIAEQSGKTAEEVRGLMKLQFGVPILRHENEAFCAKYDALVKPLPYETKLGFMMEPLDFAVTRLMTTKQHTAYLDAVHRHFVEKGFALTDPGDLLSRQDERRAA